MLLLLNNIVLYREGQPLSDTIHYQVYEESGCPSLCDIFNFKSVISYQPLIRHIRNSSQFQTQ